MCVWTKTRGSMKAVVLVATPCAKSLHGKGEKWIALKRKVGFKTKENIRAASSGRSRERLRLGESRGKIKFTKIQRREDA